MFQFGVSLCSQCRPLDETGEKDCADVETYFEDYLPGNAAKGDWIRRQSSELEIDKDGVLPFRCKTSATTLRRKSGLEPREFGDCQSYPATASSSPGLYSRQGSQTRGVSKLRSLSGSLSGRELSSTKVGLQRRNSQETYFSKDQTVIVFDWDDTLFPTHYVTEDMNLDWKIPLEHQSSLCGDHVLFNEVRRKLADCESRAAEVLRVALDLAHVVVVTLATTGWVTTSSKNFSPKVLEILLQHKVPVVYALECGPLGRAQIMKQAENLETSVDLERYYGTVKGKAIKQELDKFYSRYEGQSWKNILSVGDSRFERYGLLAASKAYMLKRRLDSLDFDGWTPTQENCWEKDDGGHLQKLRAKCCKLFDQPDPEELALELGMLVQWLESMVRLDSGFDLDLEALETEDQVRLAQAVFRGDLPARRLDDIASLVRANSDEEQIVT
eukprot:TRINITY_DN9326_c0_g1_i2.p1 TRINITY_DN9326_c0_g1~~TRINITY_DN9326_c0_g1_i2.p1  ORF type:complete len:442 (+),score=89.73 TRINITY_DN9326_c0_g1_i2:124-1449(+)